MAIIKREPTFYQLERNRIQEKLSSLSPGSAEYNEALNDLERLRKFAGEEKEMNSFFDKPGRASLLGKVVGFVGIGGLILGLTKFEKIDGQMFSGSNGEMKGGLLKSAFKLFL